MIAIFILMRWLHLLGTIYSLILVYSTFGIPLGVLVLVGFFRALPRSELLRPPGRNHALRSWRPLTQPGLQHPPTPLQSQQTLRRSGSRIVSCRPSQVFQGVVLS
jgi:hypothetical protein